MIKKLAPALVTLLIAASAQAAPVAGVSLSNVTTFTGDGPWSLGYRFTALNNISVTALGAYDLGGDGFLNAHQVGIWTAGGTLLASTTVTSANAFSNDFRYGAIASLALTAGQDYIVAASDFGGAGQDTYALTATITAAPAVQYVSSQYLRTSGLAFASVVGDSGGYFGGNFQYQDGTVPEPAPLALTGAALVALTLMRRRKA